MPVLVWQTWRWETFDDYYLLKRVVSVVTTYSLDPFWTIWWRPLGSIFGYHMISLDTAKDFDQTFWPTIWDVHDWGLSQLFIVMSVWRFLKAKWQSICEAVVFYDKQDSWILCSSFIGFICSLCTWCLDFRSKISYVCLVARVKNSQPQELESVTIQCLYHIISHIINIVSWYHMISLLHWGAIGRIMSCTWTSTAPRVSSLVSSSVATSSCGRSPMRSDPWSVALQWHGLAKLWAIEPLTFSWDQGTGQGIIMYYSLNVLIQMTNLFADVLMNSWSFHIIFLWTWVLRTFFRTPILRLAEYNLIASTGRWIGAASSCWPTSAVSWHKTCYFLMESLACIE